MSLFCSIRFSPILDSLIFIRRGRTCDQAITELINMRDLTLASFQKKKGKNLVRILSAKILGWRTKQPLEHSIPIHTAIPSPLLSYIRHQPQNPMPPHNNQKKRTCKLPTTINTHILLIILNYKNLYICEITCQR